MSPNPKAIISDEASKSLEPRFKALADFVDNHGGDDLVRHLHAQDIELVTHSHGALLKCYRTSSQDTDQPEDCWRFWVGRYEVDLNHLDEGTVSHGLAFGENDLRKPIEHILRQTKAGKLKGIEPGTLVVAEVSANTPEVRSHAFEPEGNMVVVGVCYDMDEARVANLLAGGDLEEQAIRKSSQWESHAQLQKVAELLGTDSVPLLFRGNLGGASKVVDGMRRSAEADHIFHKILDDFLSGAGENPSAQDLERFFRHSLRRFDDFEIRRLDKKGRVADATLVTRDSYKDVVQKLYHRYTDVREELTKTIDKSGRDSREHEEDYQDLNYLQAWLREEVAKVIFAQPHEDPITQAIHALRDVRHSVDEASVLTWVRRHLEEDDLPGRLYQDHIRDEHVPSSRHTGRQVLWGMFMNEVDKVTGPRLRQVIGDAT